MVTKTKINLVLDTICSQLLPSLQLTISIPFANPCVYNVNTVHIVYF